VAFDRTPISNPDSSGKPKGDPKREPARHGDMSLFAR